MDERLKVAYSRLQQIRKRTDLKLKSTKYLKETFTDFDGTEKPLKIRYYQVQGILHLVAMNRFLLGDDTGIGKCQPYDSLVLTNEGLVQMGEIEDWSEMEPDTFRPMSRPMSVLVGGEKLPIKNFYYGGVKPIVTVTTRYGFKNSGSKVHPMLVLRDGQHQWVQAQDLVEGDFLCISREESSFPEKDPVLKGGGPLKEMTPDFARFLGYYIGEGSLSSKRQVRLSQCPIKNPEIHEDMLRLFSQLFGRRPLQEDVIDLYLSDTKLRRWLHLNGLDYATSPNREVPDCILRSSKESNREFLRALFEGEGHVGKASIEFTTASERLGEQVQVMLLRFGVVARRAPKMVQGREHVYWQMTICESDAERFQSQIGFISNRKKEALSNLLDRPRNPNHDVIPQTQELFDNVREDLALATSKTGYFYDPVDSLEEGEEEVFDIEVDDPRHWFVSNGFVNHNTIQSIAACCYVWATAPNTKVIILTNKSVVGQWGLEFEKFCVDGEISVLTSLGSPAKRQKVYKEFESCTGPTVLVLGYATARQDIKFLQNYQDFILITDEATAYKNPTTQTYQVVRHLSNQASRVWALTATLIKNNLIEGYGIYSVVVPGLFPNSKNGFMQQYCITRLQPIPGGRRQIPVIVGYRKEHIALFKDKIDPYFLARAKQDVASELPILTIKTEKVGLTKAQAAKYQEALEGLLEIDTTGEEKETTKLTALIYCQQIVDHPGLIDCEGDSEKMDRLFEMLTEGDLADEKVIIYTRFRKMVDKLQEVAHSKKYKLKTVRITGSEDEDARKKAIKAFQDPNSDVKVCWITSAAAEGVNLQAAKAMVFYDSPWSAGDYIQLLGRMIRIGSVHDRCYAIHLCAQGTIDDKVMAVLRKKMKLVEAIMGKRLKGEDSQDDIVSSDNDISDIFSAMQADARTRHK